MTNSMRVLPFVRLRTHYLLVSKRSVTSAVDQENAIFGEKRKHVTPADTFGVIPVKITEYI